MPMQCRTLHHNVPRTRISDPTAQQAKLQRSNAHANTKPWSLTIAKTAKDQMVRQEPKATGQNGLNPQQSKDATLLMCSTIFPQFQADGRESYPKAIRVPANPRGEIADRAFHAAPVLRRVEVAMGIQHVGFAAWQSCQQLQIVKLPPSVISLEDGTFQGCFVLREVAAPGVSSTAEECLRSAAPLVELVSVTKRMTVMSLHQGHRQADMHLRVASHCIHHLCHGPHQKPRALPEGAFCGAGIVQALFAR